DNTGQIENEISLNNGSFFYACFKLACLIKAKIDATRPFPESEKYAEWLRSLYEVFIHELDHPEFRRLIVPKYVIEANNFIEKTISSNAIMGQPMCLAVSAESLFDALVKFSQLVKAKIDATRPSSASDKYAKLLESLDELFIHELDHPEFRRLIVPKYVIEANNFIEKTISSNAIMGQPMCLAVSAAAALLHYRFGGSLDFFKFKEDVDFVLKLGERIYKYCLSQEKLPENSLLKLSHLSNTIFHHGRTLWPDFYLRYDEVQSITQLDLLEIDFNKVCGFICGIYNSEHAVCVMRDSKTDQYALFDSCFATDNNVYISQFVFLSYKKIRDFLINFQ
ncbi:hypothetical protein BOX15_Mlig003804g1, partial [Macrostomum lignano]